LSYHVRVEPSGHVFEVEDGETVLEAALRQGVVLPYSCRNGSCASCKGRVRSGTVDTGVYEPHALSDTERAAGLALFCQARPRTDLVIEAREVESVRDIPIRTLPARVESLERVADDVMILRFRLPQTERLQFLAGQYVDILLPGGARRAFSLANAPESGELFELHIRRVPGGRFTTQVFETMKPKHLLRLRGPLGTFFLREDSWRPALFVAGGTGLAPVQAMLAQAFRRKRAQPIQLYWGARTRGDLYRDALLRAWADAHPMFHYTPVLSAPAPGEPWSGRTGWVHEAVIADHPDLAGFDVYASGPPAMVTALCQASAAAGLPPEQLYYDSFEFAHAAK
jgi:CDP-4-dehydro-6-deoxyglucose reductase, E3